MIVKFTFGHPFNAESVINDTAVSKGALPFGTVKKQKKDGAPAFSWKYFIEEGAQVFGLGETMRGIDKKGFIYISDNTDQPMQNECTSSLYASHNFIIVFGKDTFGLFFDYPGKMTFDLAFTKRDEISVSCERADINLYFITPQNEKNSLKEIVSEFRSVTGQSYIPPEWAFGFCQSRWGYKTQADIEKVWKTYRRAGFPIDSICMDIDYMEDYKDFTVDSKKFPDFAALNKKLKKDGVRLVPIIDAGIKKQNGYKVYEECVGSKYACEKADGKTFVAGVWPGDSVFTDFLNTAARSWFGKQYKALTDAGVEGFWNDMNEPALFYTPEGLKETFAKLDEFKTKALDVTGLFEFSEAARSVSNNKKDYARFFHKVSAKKAGAFAATKPDKDGNVLVNHKDVHNLYGYNMTRGAAEAFKEMDGEKRKLLYSRSSFIGSHRYGGIWTGDNNSYWGDILLSLHQMAGLNMTGFMFTGSDVGGFNNHTSRDLLLRWTAFSVFTPLFRNHSAYGTREQEYYQFEAPEDFKSMVELRYALIPYLYSEFVKAAVKNQMYFRPLAFDFSNDERACHTEDQILLGNEIMVAPVYVQNAQGRYVYMPEEMTQVVWQDGKVLSQKKISKGDHWVDIPLNAVVFFVRRGKKIPLAKAAPSTDKIDTSRLTFIGDKTAKYELYEDDGFTTNIKLEGRIRKI